MRKIYSDAEISFLIENYSKRGGEFCATYLSRSPATTRVKARSLGLKISPELRSLLSKNKASKPRKKGYKVTRKTPLEKQKVKSSIFSSPSTPEAAYVLGLIWADGTLANKNTISFTINKSDAEEIREVVLKTGNWTVREEDYRDKHPTWKSYISYQAYNKELSDYLIKKGYAAKSGGSACSILASIPTELTHYWFRGLIDGDGYISTRNNMYLITITSVYNQDWSFCENLFKTLGVRYRIRRDSYINKVGKLNQRSIIKTNDKSSVIKLLDYIYAGNQFGFSRKHNIYKQLKLIN